VKIMAAIGDATGCGLEELVQLRDQVNAMKENIARP
jgi:hypothetical protein